MCRVGIEPTTLGLRDPRSTAELSARILARGVESNHIALPRFNAPQSTDNHYLEDTLHVAEVYAAPQLLTNSVWAVVYHQSNGGSTGVRTQVDTD